MLPDGDGYSLFNALKAYQASIEKAMVPVLFISAKDEEMDRILGFALGADDYITKPFSPKEVAYRVKARLKTSPVDALQQWNRDASVVSQVDPSIIRFGEVTIQVDAGEVWRGGHQLAMTAKEFKLLLYLAQNPNRILSKETLGEAVWGEIVWGDDYQGFDNTLSVHMRKLRLKIEEDPARPKWLQTVIGLGYKFVMRQKGESP
jgi:DNA-binding response OmpR family regulator